MSQLNCYNTCHIYRWNLTINMSCLNFGKHKCAYIKIFDRMAALKCYSFLPFLLRGIDWLIHVWYQYNSYNVVSSIAMIKKNFSLHSTLWMVVIALMALRKSSISFEINTLSQWGYVMYMHLLNHVLTWRVLYCTQARMKTALPIHAAFTDKQLLCQWVGHREKYWIKCFQHIWLGSVCTL